ncbi:hypothetical protein [uncultured Paraglaciecola sp.]|uniref:hypothetical protein n=1 Tax=uncultured Paraglaciecola sp. TaxID=1765024 RepID=UPI002632CEB6|nr:hypothetical protein [uncultured Paraglaciecola sp.]
MSKANQQCMLNLMVFQHQALRVHNKEMAERVQTALYALEDIYPDDYKALIEARREDAPDNGND